MIINSRKKRSKRGKHGWRVKKRRHDEGPSHQVASVTPTKPNATGKNQPPQKKETSSGVKDQTCQSPRRPLQESSKQNVTTPTTGSTTAMKGVKTAMPIEQVGPNHFKFSEENKPPDAMVDSMELIEESNEKIISSSEGVLQEDCDMGLDTNPSDGSPT